MIIATAGHIDHGKTLLVKALTGIDADRLPEEKNRGLTIDLGYAYQPLADGEVLGFVDVPGHERFVRNMLAGVTGIQFALLVVAADDGPMPQTVEHLQILDLLSISNGAVALTKIDRVEPARVAEVTEDIEILLAGTTLEGAPIFPVSALTGKGVPALAARLAEAAHAARASVSKGNFRLAVDRVFSVAGAGHVVTGTVFSGTVAPGDQLVLSPRGIQVRVRGLHAQNREAQTGGVGVRCALNIAAAGLEKDHIHRGDWVLSPRAHHPVTKIDARIRVLRSEARPLRHWSPVHVHLGAADVTGRVAVLQDRAIAPGESALAQLVLDHPIGAVHGDRLILRDQSAQHTIAGGSVIDIFPPRRGRARPERLAVLDAMEAPAPEEALTRRLAIGPVELPQFAAAWNLTEAEEKALFDVADMVRAGPPGGEVALRREEWDRLAELVIETLGAWHKEAPDRPGLSEPQLRARVPERIDGAVLSGLVETLLRERRLAGAGRILRLPGHEQVMSPADQALWKQVRPILDATFRQPPSVHDMARDLRVEARQLQRFLRRMQAMGHVAAVAENRFLLTEAQAELGEVAEALAKSSTDGRFTARDFRDRAGIGRNLTIEVLEHFDRLGFTRRDGDTRIVLKSASDVF